MAQLPEKVQIPLTHTQQLPIVNNSQNNPTVPILEPYGGINEQFTNNFVQLQAEIKRLEKVQREFEMRITEYLRKNFVEPYRNEFLTMLGTYYPWNYDLITKYYPQLKDKNIKFNQNMLAEGFDWKKLAAQTNNKINDEFVYASFASRNIAPNLLKKITPNLNALGWIYIFQYAPFWNETLIAKYSPNFDLSFEVLSKNQRINWTRELLLKFQPKLNALNLSANLSLPWDEEGFVVFFKETFFATNDIQFYKQEISNIKNILSRSWECKSQNRYFDWTPEYIAENKEELHWDNLSANPALPFSLALFFEYQDDWHYDKLFDNKGFYDKVFAPILTNAIVDDLMRLYYV